MPFTNRPRQPTVRILAARTLAIIDDRLSEWGLRLSIPVLLAALITGETLPWLDGRQLWVSGAVIRGAHITFGLLVMLLALGHVGGLALRGIRHMVRYRSVHPGAALALLRKQPPLRRVLDGAYIVLLTLVLYSGLVRLALWGSGHFAPDGFLPPWMVLHRAALPYLYAVLLFLFVIRGKLFYTRMLAYLHAP